MITWKLALLVGSPWGSGSYRNIHSGHFIDENGNEYDEYGVFIQNIQDIDDNTN